MRFSDLARGNCGDATALFETYTAEWHESGTSEPLHVWLGLTWGEYAAIVENPLDIARILNP
jgi:hypothetical protein